MNDLLVDIVAYAGLAVFVLGDLMIASAAYRRGLIWGLIGLVPVLNFYYVATAWTNNKTRNGFLMLVAGALAVAVAFYGGADEAVSETAQKVGREVGVQVPEIQMPVRAPGTDVEVSNEEEVRALGLDTEESVLDRPDYESEQVAIEPLRPDDQPAIEVREVKRAYYPVCPDDLAGREGRPLRLSMADGTVLEGKLVSADTTSLMLEQYRHGGIVNFQYAFKLIDKIEVLEVVRGPVPKSIQCGPATAPIVPAPEPTTEAAPEPSAPAPVVLPPPGTN